MTPELTAEFFEEMLGLEWPWYVDHTRFDAAKHRLVLHLDYETGGTFTCAACGTDGCKAYDNYIRHWRHLDFWGVETHLRAPSPRVTCPRCGIRQSRVPWARGRQRFTERFEEFVANLAREMPVRAVARILGEHDTRLWRIVNHRSEAPEGVAEGSQLL